MRILSVIPARGGSKGLPGKNIVDLAGRPLIAWTIEASLRSSSVTRTVVSSDDPGILDIAAREGAEVLTRPAELALDTTPSQPVVRHALEQTPGTWDWVMLLQPTSPLRTASHVDQSIDLVREGDATSVISVCLLDNKVLKAFLRDANGYLHGMVNDRFPFMRRQDLPEVFMPNGAIYLVKVEEFLRTGSLVTDRTLPFVMGADESIDVDSEEDLADVSRLIRA